MLGYWCSGEKGCVHGRWERGLVGETSLGKRACVCWERDFHGWNFSTKVSNLGVFSSHAFMTLKFMWVKLKVLYFLLFCLFRFLLFWKQQCENKINSCCYDRQLILIALEPILSLSHAHTNRPIWLCSRPTSRKINHAITICLSRWGPGKKGFSWQFYQDQ